MHYPKISIITPSYNQGAYIEETIQSVLNQNYPNLEYIIIDGGSTDNSVDIIKKYATHLSYWFSEPDDGVYHALQKGFERSTGEIMGWINSDDMLHPKSLFTIAEILSLEGVQWIQGIPNVFDESGRSVRIDTTGKWSFLRLNSENECIQQESTFWKRDLWKKAGGYISTKYRLAGDFDLWNRFFKYEKLYTPLCLVGGFRIRRQQQLSLDSEGYWKEVSRIRNENVNDERLISDLKKLNRLKKLKNRLSKTRILNLFFLINRIEEAINKIHNFPKQIVFNRELQKFEILDKN